MHPAWYGWVVPGETPSWDQCLFLRCRAIHPINQQVFEITRCHRTGMPLGKHVKTTIKETAAAVNIYGYQGTEFLLSALLSPLWLPAHTEAWDSALCLDWVMDRKVCSKSHGADVGLRSVTMCIDCVLEQQQLDGRCHYDFNNWALNAFPLFPWPETITDPMLKSNTSLITFQGINGRHQPECTDILNTLYIWISFVFE